MATTDQQAREIFGGLVPWLAVIAWFSGGASVGVLVGHALSVGLSVNEFGALGNWVAGLGTLGALVLAYLVHRRDVRARDDDRRREEIREYNRRRAAEDEASAEDLTQRTHARLVQANLAVASSRGINGEPKKYLLHLNATVVNKSPEPIADVVLRTRWPDIKPNWLEVPPRAREAELIRVRDSIELPPDVVEAREFIQENLELRFRMYDRLWSWTPEGGVHEYTEGQDVTETAKTIA